MPPWTENIAAVVTPTSSANGVSNPVNPDEKFPLASTGSPETTFPNAIPSSSASPSEARPKTASHVERQRGDFSFDRNSRATVRRIRTSRTSMNALYIPENSEA